MLYVTFSAPCTYDRSQRGFDEKLIAYTGEEPLTTAEKYIRRIPGARLWAVVHNNRIVYGQH